MKKKIFLTLLVATVFACLLVFTAFAAEPDVSGETVTLKNGTVLPIWDTDGDALIWYKSTDNSEDGYADYDYIKAQASEVDYKTNWAGGISGVHANQVGTVTITVNDKTYSNGDLVVFNIKDEDVVVTSSAHGSVGKSVNCISNVFNKSTNIEFVFLKLDTVAIQGSAFYQSTSIRYVNFEELTELRQIVGQNFSGCTSFFDGETLDLSNTKMTNIQSGTFNNTPIGKIILPKGLTSLNSWSLQGLTKIKEIHIPETVTVFGDTMFKNCSELEKVTGFKSLFDRGVLTSIPSATFLDCHALKSVDLPDTYTSIGSHAFQGTWAYSGTLVLPHECTTLGSNAFHSSGFETIVLSPNITVIPIYAFCQSYVKNVFIPSGDTEIGREAFRDVKNKVVVYYTGNSADELKSVTVNNYNGVILDNSSIIVSADEFDLENKENQHYVVYGYDHCEAFFGGHSWLGTENVVVTGYFNDIEIKDSCGNCKKTSVVKTIAAIFVWRGYSCSTYGNSCSVAQCFYVNKNSVEQYTIYSPDFDYGVLATGNASGEPTDPKIGDEKVLVGNFIKSSHDYVIMKVSGISEDYFNKCIIFCAYVIDGEKMHYLDGGVSGEKVVGISYNDILSMQQKFEA